jgi:hypothetical protein
MILDGGKQTKCDSQTHARVLELLTNIDMGIIKISDVTGVPKSTIKCWRDEDGIEKRPVRWDPQIRTSVLTCLAAKMKAKEINVITDVSVNIINARKRAALAANSLQEEVK